MACLKLSLGKEYSTISWKYDWLVSYNFPEKQTDTFILKQGVSWKERKTS